MIYDLPNIELPVSQGDIIDGCPLFRQLATGEVVDLEEKPAGWLSRVIVLTQACDLAHTKTNKVLVAVVHDAAELVQKGILKASARHPHGFPTSSSTLGVAGQSNCEVRYTLPRAHRPAFHRHLRAHRSAGTI